MSGHYHKLHWQEKNNGVRIDCDLDIAIHPSDGCIVLLTIPGVDGSVDGYKDKYVTIAENAIDKHDISVVRMSNPFITSFHWESNVGHALDFITQNANDFTGTIHPEIRIMAHSAGAAVIAQIAHQYPQISRLLIINPATKLGLVEIVDGLNKFHGKTTVLFGSIDPSVSDAAALKEITNLDLKILEGVDHHFSGKALQDFIAAPETILFD